MAHSYTPGLTVSERTVVRKRRMLPIPGAVIADVNDFTVSDDVVARAELPGKVHPLNLANLLGVAPDEVSNYLVKKPGEAVQRDEIIAENRPFIRWFKTQLRSPITGTLESVSAITGQVLLREPPRTLDVLAYIDERGVEVMCKQGVVIETECSLVQGIFGIGGET